MRFPFLLLAFAALCHCGDDTGASPQQPPPPVVDAGSDVQAPADAATEAGPKVAFSVATFNVRRFFDTVCDSGACTSNDFEQVVTQQQLDARADQVAGAIRDMKVAAVSLQEIETQTAFETLSSRLSDIYPTALLGETGYTGSLDVAILGSGPIIEIRKHKGTPITKPDGTQTWFTRELLEIHMDLSGLRLVLFSAHFRSKNDDDPGRRIAEARATRDYVVATSKEFPDAAVMLGGDLNDTPGSEPLLELESAPELLRVASDRPVSEVSTYSYQGKLFALDHIFLASSAKAGYVPGSAKAVRDAGAEGLAGSDHASLRADFYLK